MTEPYPTIKRSFNEEFCAQLEYHLSKAFGNSTDNEISQFWCDGISMPFIDYQLSEQSVFTTKQISTEAWLGESGQTVYQAIIKLGVRSIKNCETGLELKDCLPNAETLDWVTIDIQKRTIEIQLA